MNAIAGVGTAVRTVHGKPADGVPPSIVRIAFLTALLPLPSGLWRIAVGFGAQLGPLDPAVDDTSGSLPGWLPFWVFVILLTVVMEGLAFLTVGLVSRWGEVFPRWMPRVGGRRVPVAAAVVPAVLGAAALMAVLSPQSMAELNDFATSDGGTVELTGWRWTIFLLAYGPLYAWGPLLMVVTIAYYWRRRRSG